MFEVIIEAIGEIILQGVVEVSISRRVHPLIRYPLILLIVLILLGVGGGLAYLGISGMQAGYSFMGIILTALSFVVFYYFYRYLKRHVDASKKEDN